MPAAKDSNIVKIAVELTDQIPQLIDFNQKQPLSGIIQDLCNRWALQEPEQYALQFSDTNKNRYITEKNRNEIKNGFILRLEYSPMKTANDILQKLNSPEEKTAALEKLSNLCSDITFALEFINKQGLALLISHIESGKYKSNTLAYSLRSFVELMEHGIVSWDILEAAFITKVCSFVNAVGNAATVDFKIVQASLSILENIILNSSDKYNQVEKEVNYGNLTSHLQNTEHPAIQMNTIALINALFLKANQDKRRVLQTMISDQFRNVIISSIILNTPANALVASNEVGKEMAHQLYKLQTLTLGLLEERMLSKMDPQDQDAHDKIKELRKIAFESDVTMGSIGNNSGFLSNDTAKKQLGAKDYKKLGFKSDINPALDFTETPPGVLALDCMVYFARNHTESYTKVVLENSCRIDEHECPFGKTSVELVKLLCEVLRIGEPPSEQGETYYPMFFTHDHPFYEFYCIAIVLLNKTWKEMRATTEDFVKVFSVVREQINRALTTRPPTFDKFKQQLQRLTYQEITKLWQQERVSREEWESHAKPIVELKELITPDIIDLIQQQRLAFLVEGTRFTKYSSRGQRIKDKYWYVRLSPNHKILHYGDCDEKTAPTLEELVNKLAVQDIKGLITGKECPHMREARGRKTTHQLAFSLMLDDSAVQQDVTSLDFIAPDDNIFNYWTDAMNALLGLKMVSNQMKKDLETLLSMDIKLRLLDAEGIDIPQNPPPVPDSPSNYNFCYDLK